MPVGGSARGGLWVVAAAILAVVSLGAAALTWAGGRSSSEERPSTPPRVELATSSPPAGSALAPSSPREAPTQRGATAHPDAGAPHRIVIESLGLDAAVVPVATDGRTLDPPADPRVLGWWSGGALAGAARGTALVTGHTVHDGGGALDDLERIRSGSTIRVGTPAGGIDYVTQSVEVLGKVALARRAEELFSQEVEGRLVLVTCEDWDGSGYRSNVVVTAAPEGG